MVDDYTHETEGLTDWHFQILGFWGEPIWGNNHGGKWKVSAKLLYTAYAGIIQCFGQLQ